MEFKDIVVDNDAIVNTEPKELPKEAHDIPQGVKPHLNPNPGYGEDGKTVPAIKTDLVEGERGTPVDVVTEPRPAFKTVQEVYNFLNGIKIKGKSLEEYIDSQGGVTEEELQAAITPLAQGLNGKANIKVFNHSFSNLTSSEIANLQAGDIVVDDNPSAGYVGLILSSSKIISSCFGSGNVKTYVYHKVGDTWSPLSSKSVNLHDIEVNPTLDGTESLLNGLKFDGTKYKIPVGTKLYKHAISGTIDLEGEEYNVGGYLISTRQQVLSNTDFDNICFNNSNIEILSGKLDLNLGQYGILLNASSSCCYLLSSGDITAKYGGNGASITDTVTEL